METFRRTVAEATSSAQGGVIEYGGKVLDDRQGFFVEPTIISLPLPRPTVDTAGSMITSNGSGGHSHNPSPSPSPSPCPSISEEERFVPILYVMKINSFEEAIQINNSVLQGLSSSLFTQVGSCHSLASTSSVIGIINTSYPSTIHPLLNHILSINRPYHYTV